MLEINPESIGSDVSVMEPEEPIGFYEGEFAVLSCFSAHAVSWDGVLGMTAEHVYQAEKFCDPRLKQLVRSATSAYEARELGQRHKDSRRADWDKVKRHVMKQILRAKLAQHEDVRRILLSTGTRLLVKDLGLDAYWGTGPDGKGRNELGRIWMELRDEVPTWQMFRK